MKANGDVMSARNATQPPLPHPPAGRLIDCRRVTNCVCDSKTCPFNNSSNSDRNKNTFAHRSTCVAWTFQRVFNALPARRRRGRVWRREVGRGVGRGLQRPERSWLSGLLKSFWGSGLEWIVCHTRVTLSLSDEPPSYAINSVIARKRIYLICEAMTVLLDLWRKARFN